MYHVQRQQRINEIGQVLQVDFVGLALATIDKKRKYRDIRWCHVFGNTTTHYEQIRLQVGKGIAGTVWRTGRGFVETDLQQYPERLVELPIARIEGLNTVAAYPVIDKGRVKGVLMIGFREAQPVSPSLLATLNQYSNYLVDLL